MATTDENDASKASAASPRGPEGAEMMPDLPEPWEGLVEACGIAMRETGVYEPDRDYLLAANHAAYEAERALRVNLLALLAGSEKPAAS